MNEKDKKTGSDEEKTGLTAEEFQMKLLARAAADFKLFDMDSLLRNEAGPDEKKRADLISARTAEAVKAVVVQEKGDLMSEDEARQFINGALTEIFARVGSGPEIRGDFSEGNAQKSIRELGDFWRESVRWTKIEASNFLYFDEEAKDAKYSIAIAPDGYTFRKSDGGFMELNDRLKVLLINPVKISREWAAIAILGKLWSFYVEAKTLMPSGFTKRENFLGTERGADYCLINALHFFSGGRYMGSAKRFLKNHHLVSAQEGVLEFLRDEENCMKMADYFDRELSFERPENETERKLRLFIYKKAMITTAVRVISFKRRLTEQQSQWIEMEMLEKFLIDQGLGGDVPV